MTYRTKGARARIAEAAVEGAAAMLAAHGNPDELIIRDLDLRGFVLRLRLSGRHAYALVWGRGKGHSRILGTTDKLTAGMARKVAREQLANVALHGTPSLPDRRRALTLREFLDRHYEPWAAEHLKTHAETLARLRVNFADLLDERLAGISTFALERWRTARLKAGRRKSTINRDVVALKAALARAVSWGHLQKHPLAGLRAYRIDERSVIRFLSTDEERRLLEALAARDMRHREARDSGNRWRQARGYELRPTVARFCDHLTPLVTVALHTGLRRGELFNLRWRDVDFVGALVTVCGAGAKSGQTRHVPLNRIALKALEEWKRDQVLDAAALVWPGAEGAALEDVKKGWAPVLRAAAVPAFRFHDLRHTFASRLVMAGVDLNTVRELLGHADLKMTIRYAHLAPEMKAAAVAKLVSA